MKTIDTSRTLIYVLLGSVCFHVAYLYPPFSLLILGYLFALVQLAHARSPRWAFYSGLAGEGHLPCDRWLAPFSTFVTLVLCLGLFARYLLRAREAVPVRIQRIAAVSRK